jgi:hypothetical protein
VTNPGDKVCGPVFPEEIERFTSFLDSHDFSPNTRRSFLLDFRNFAAWFCSANKERFAVTKVTTRDMSDYRDSMRREQGRAGRVGVGGRFRGRKRTGRVRRQLR